MTGSKQLAYALCILFGMYTPAHAQSSQGEPRGKLLYATYCNACHTLEIHWREQKLATDWASLKAWVRHWQASIGQSWNEEEITEVAEYLNASYYGFPVIDRKGMSQGEKYREYLRYF